MTTMERRPDSRGKVRDIYDAGENLLMVATDRISAFDFILPDEIPFKGEVLNRISAFWFDKFADIVPNHLVSIDPADFPRSLLSIATTSLAAPCWLRRPRRFLSSASSAAI